MPTMTKRGTDPKTVMHQARCSNCKSEYQYTLDDPNIHIGHSQDPRDQGSVEVTFACTVCGSAVLSFPRGN